MLQGLVLHFCLLKSYGTLCLSYTNGICFFVCMCVYSFDHDGSYHSQSTDLVLDNALEAFNISTLDLMTTGKKKSCVPNNADVSWGLLISRT